MRVCLVYDCLYPWTIGGAERWMRGLAEALVEAGHEVTYLTRRQWPEEDPPVVPGVRVVAVSRREGLYGPDGNRTIGEPLRFGAGVARHLARHGHRYDVVHTANFPFFSLLAAGALRRRGGYRIEVDWHEVWSDAYWRAYLPAPQAAVAALVQRACARVPQRSWCFSALTARRVRELDARREPVVLPGLAADPGAREPIATSVDAEVVFVGRLIADKRPVAAVHALAVARRQLPRLRGAILGDGPEREAVTVAIAEHDATSWLRSPGFVSDLELDRALSHASCLVLPSSREGYGMVVVEAAARGVPSVVVAGEDNAATERIEQGVNGLIAASASPEDLAGAIVDVLEAGEALRASTVQWYADHMIELSAERSYALVVDVYGGDRPTPASDPGPVGATLA